MLVLPTTLRPTHVYHMWHLFYQNFKKAYINKTLELAKKKKKKKEKD